MLAASRLSHRGAVLAGRRPALLVGRQGQSACRRQFSSQGGEAEEHPVLQVKRERRAQRAADEQALLFDIFATHGEIAPADGGSGQADLITAKVTLQLQELRLVEEEEEEDSAPSASLCADHGFRLGLQRTRFSGGGGAHAGQGLFVTSGQVQPGDVVAVAGANGVWRPEVKKVVNDVLNGAGEFFHSAAINHTSTGDPPNCVPWQINALGSGSFGLPRFQECSPATAIVAVSPVAMGSELTLDYALETADTRPPVWFEPCRLKSDVETRMGDTLRPIDANVREAARAELVEWRQTFEALHGRNATIQDIQSDPVANALFAAFSASKPRD